MSEIVLSNTEYDYTNGSMIVDINPGLKNDSSNNNNSTATSNTVPTTSFEEAYSSYPGYPPNYPMARLGYFQDKVQPTSPESSISSTSSPTPSPSPPNQLNHFTSQQPILTTTTASANNDLLTPLDSTRFSNSTTARVKEMITRANSVPMEFYHTEFLEYSKETYEKKMESKRNKRKRTSSSQPQQQQKKLKKGDQSEDEDDEDEDEDEIKSEDRNNMTSAEIRRQIHIQSEQKRRAQIKDGFDELRKHLPGCNNKKMSKAALLTRTVQQLQHLKNMQTELLSEVERLIQENESLKKFQHSVLQRQAMEKMYTF
ncbi:hypothetical protein BCV72DRAFT_206062 [Rhizopus microsporus var. microsporus]|uniref:BHLH domain-containing protein n=1 Tax=Rhizopus microsporus var. microsporus TaxID=86635 RepID=A0A1X0R536_RHIZD|nr:hypothetical protein BCV72DRAFT_206062 [Rhizopus microsporus var. microsporus]